MEAQTKRFQDRINDLRKIWKLSPMDMELHERWYDDSRARNAMFEVEATDTEISRYVWLVLWGLILLLKTSQDGAKNIFIFLFDLLARASILVFNS